MRTDPFLFKRRHFRASVSHGPLHQVVNTKSSEGLAETIQEHPFLRSTTAHEFFKHADRLWPQRTTPKLRTLTRQLNGAATAPGEIPNCDMHCLIDSCTGVVQEQQHSIVASALFSASIRRPQYRIHLRFIQIGHHGLADLPKGYSPDCRTPGDVLRAMLPDEFCQRVDRTESQVASGAAAVEFLFEMFEKTANHLR